MTSKHRLIDTSCNPLARELLRSAELDEPPEHSVVRLALALGLGSSAVVSTIATGAGAATEAALSAAAATAAKGVGVAATGVSAAVGANATTGAAAVSGAMGSNIAAGAFVASGTASVAAGSAALASGTGIAAAGAAAPAVTTALSAVGLLKAMAVVSLTCGALSFGGTKLAMTIAEPSAPATSVSRTARAPAEVQKKPAAHTRAIAHPVSEAALVPPPPVTTDVDDDVVPALGQDSRPVNVPGDSPRMGATERGVGRQNINTDPMGNLAGKDIDPMQQSMATAELTTAPATVGPRQAAIAAFPSDDERPAPVAGAAPEKKAKARAKPAKVDTQAERELELVLLNRARGAVAAGQPLVALQALELYRTQAPRGVLYAESVVLQIQALLALGQRSAAERLAIPFIKAAPQSRQAARARELLGLPDGSP